MTELASHLVGVQALIVSFTQFADIVLFNLKQPERNLLLNMTHNHLGIIKNNWSFCLSVFIIYCYFTNHPKIQQTKAPQSDLFLHQGSQNQAREQGSDLSDPEVGGSV